MPKDIKSVEELEARCQEYKSEYEWLWNLYCNLVKQYQYGNKN